MCSEQKEKLVQFQEILKKKIEEVFEEKFEQLKPKELTVIQLANLDEKIITKILSILNKQIIIKEEKLLTREEVLKKEFNRYRYYNWQKVLEICEKYLNHFPNDLFFLSYKAEAQFESNQKDEAKKIAEFIVKKIPKTEEDHFAIGKSFGLLEMYDLSFPYILKSAELDFAPAIGYLGWMYETGNGLTKDLQKAFTYYSKAANRGNTLSQFNLGLIYYFGKGGFSEDRDLAFKFFKLSSEGGYPKAFHYIGCLYFDEKKYSEAVKFFEKGASLGDESSAMFMAECYKTGKGVEMNLEKAFELYKFSAEKGELHSQLNLAICYYNGSGTQRDPVLAFEWHKKAAEKGCQTSQYNLGLHYQVGYGINQDLRLSFHWFTKSSEQGNLSAKREIARAFFRGDGVPQNTEKAFEMINYVISKDPLQLKYAQEFRDNIEIATKSVEVNGMALEYLSPQLQLNKNLVIKALKQNKESKRFIPTELENDYDIFVLKNRMYKKLNSNNQNFTDCVLIFSETTENDFEKTKRITLFLEYFNEFRVEFISRTKNYMLEILNESKDIEITKLILIIQKTKDLLDTLK